MAAPICFVPEHLLADRNQAETSRIEILDAVKLRGDQKSAV